MSYITREDWGARPYEDHYLMSKDKVVGLALHWPAMGHQRLDTVAKVSAALRSWQRYHMDTKGWSDIAYQVAIDQEGNRYGLRGIRYRSAANGGTEVNLTHGAVLLVLGDGETPTKSMVAAVRRVVLRHRAVFPRSRQLVGHKDIRPEPTACPGPIVSTMLEHGVFEPKAGKR